MSPKVVIYQLTNVLSNIQNSFKADGYFNLRYIYEIKTNERCTAVGLYF